MINLNGGGVEKEVPDESKQVEVTWLRPHWVLGNVLIPRWEVIFSPDAWWARWSCGSDARHSYDGSQRWGCKPGMYLNHIFTIIGGYPKTIGNGRGPVYLSQGKWTLKIHIFIKSCPESFWEIRVIPTEAKCQDVTGLSLFFWDGSTRACSVKRAV